MDFEPDSAPRGESSTVDPTEAASILAFRLQDLHVAVETRYVDEICDHQQPTWLPGVPPHIVGLIQLHGEGIPVVDMAQRLGLVRTNGEEEPAASRRHRIVVVSASTYRVGILCDRVVGVFVICREDLGEPEAFIGGPVAEFSRGQWQSPFGLVAVMDAAALLESSSFTASPALR